MKKNENVIEQLILEDIKTIENHGAKARRESALREYYKNPNYCLCCSKIINTQIGHAVHGTRRKKFCDCSCAASYNNRKRDGQSYKIETILDKCSDEDFINAYYSSSTYTELALTIGYSNRINSKLRGQIKDRINNLCLDEYPDKTKSIYSMTKGELFLRCSNWQSWRSTIQKDARYVYKNSSKSKECIVCGYNKTYEVAHIKSVSSFSDEILISEINNIDNLVALCPNHHWEYDRGLINLNEYI